MASRSSSFRPACARASRTTGTICRRCSREASSGTTPPYLRCTSTCDATTLDRISRPSATTAAAVSSQEDSIPRMRVLIRRILDHCRSQKKLRRRFLRPKGLSYSLLSITLKFQAFQVFAEFASKFLVLQSDLDRRFQESQLVAGVVRGSIINV